MSGWEGILLAILTISSVCAAYWAGQQNILWRMRQHDERRRERYRRWAKFYDEED